MKNTFDPQLIYDVFDRSGFKCLRIDQFDSGNFAKLRVEIEYERLSSGQLLEIATRLISLEKNENIDIQVVHVNMVYRTMTLHVSTREEEVTLMR